MPDRPTGPDDRYLVINPFFHSFGLKAGILACVVSGSAIVPQAVFDVPQTMALITDQRITVLPGSPTHYTSLLGHPDARRFDLSSLRLAVTGAATVPPALVEQIRTELGANVLTAYGLTEAVVATMCRPGDDAQTVAQTCRRAAVGGGPVRAATQRLGQGPQVSAPRGERRGSLDPIGVPGPRQQRVNHLRRLTRWHRRDGTVAALEEQQRTVVAALAERGHPAHHNRVVATRMHCLDPAVSPGQCPGEDRHTGR